MWWSQCLTSHEPHCTSLQLLQVTDANQCTAAFSGPKSQHTVVMRTKVLSTQLAAVTRPSGQCTASHNRIIPRLEGPHYHHHILRVSNVVIDINVRFKCFRVAPRAAVCPLEATNQFHVPFPLVTALLPFSGLAAVTSGRWVPERLEWSTAPAEEQSSCTYRVSHSEWPSLGKSVCTSAQPQTVTRPPSAESRAVVVAHVWSQQQIKHKVRGQPAARRTKKRIRKGAALAYSANRIAWGVSGKQAVQQSLAVLRIWLFNPDLAFIATF